MPFTAEEIAGRIARLRDEMRVRNLDAMLLDDCEATAYFFNYDVSLSSYRCGIVPLDGEPFFILRALDVAPIREMTWLKPEKITGYPDWVQASDAVTDTIKAEGLGKARIGIDLRSHALTVSMYKDIKAALPEAELIDIDNLPWTMRKNKSPAEIGLIKRACEIADQSIAEIVAAAKHGMTEREAGRMAVEAYVRLGGDPGEHGVITSGNDWDFLHGHLHDRPLKEGDVLHLELIPRFEGYSSRIMRNIVIGKPTAHQSEVYGKLIELQDAQLAAMKPGAIACDVDAIVRRGAVDAGIRTSYDNITGYTLGYYSALPLRVSDFTWVFLPTSEWKLEDNMVFHMYASAEGLAISETVLVTPQGGRRLNTTPRKLFSTAA